jgi:hypothetical protein
MICFPRKRCPSISTACVIRTWIRRVRKFGSSKDIEVRGILKKESRSNEPASCQADRHGYLPELKIEIPEQMLDRANNSNARSAVTKNLGPNQLLAGDLI